MAHDGAKVTHSSYVAGAALDESRNPPVPGSAEHTATTFEDIKKLWLEAQQLGHTPAAHQAYSAARSVSRR